MLNVYRKKLFSQVPLHIQACTRRYFHTQKPFAQQLLHSEIFTHKGFCTEKLLHRGAFAHRRLYAQKLLHRGACTHKGFYIQNLLHREVFTHRSFYTGKPLHRAAFTCFKIANLLQLLARAKDASDVGTSQFCRSFCRPTIISRARVACGVGTSQVYFSFWRSTITFCDSVVSNFGISPFCNIFCFCILRCKIAILPQVWTLGPHFVPKGCVRPFKITILPQFWPFVRRARSPHTVTFRWTRPGCPCRHTREVQIEVDHLQANSCVTTPV